MYVGLGDSSKDVYMSSPTRDRDSLARIILTLESNIAKQNALQHILNGLRVMYARDAVIAALTSNNKMDAPVTGKRAFHEVYAI